VVASALAHLLNPGAEQPVTQTISASPDLVLVGCVAWLLVAALAMGCALSRAGVR
jgi:hypothetical protein